MNRHYGSIGTAGRVWLVSVLCAGLTLFFSSPWAAAADEVTVSMVSGDRPSLDDLPSYGAIALITRDGENDFEIDGNDDALNLIDGRNHDFNGNLVGSGDRPAVSTDVDESDIQIQDVTLEGSDDVVGGAESFDAEEYAKYYLARADLVIEENTTYNGGTIGSPSDFQIVVLKDANLTLMGDFAGYGILILYDTNPGNGLTDIRMEDEAKWCGVILSYTGDTPGDSDKIRMRFGRRSGGSMAGAGLGDGVRVIGTILAVGREIEIEFPNPSIGEVLYSSEVIAAAELAVGSKPYQWERWRELE